MEDAAALDRRWPPRQVPADLEAEAQRLLDWAHGDWAPTGGAAAATASPARRPAPSVGVAATSVAHGSSYLGGREDPWQDILNARDAGGFCEVPRSLLRQLRREGEAQLAEIAELRAQLARLPDLEDEVLQMEAELQELQSNCVVTANEIELRKLEAETLEKETDRLYNEKEERVKRLEMLNAQADEIEFWLDAAGHAPVGPEGRARVERYRAAAAQAAAEQARRAAGDTASLEMASDAAVVFSPMQWKESFQQESEGLLEASELEDLEKFMEAINPSGRSLTSDEVKAAAGNPQLGLSRHLRGLVAKVTSEAMKDAAGGGGAPADAAPAAQPASSTASTLAVPAEVTLEPVEASPDKEKQEESKGASVASAAAKAESVKPPAASEPAKSAAATASATAAKDSKAAPPTDAASTAKVEPKPSALDLAAAIATTAAKAPVEEEAEEDAFFTKDEWMEFFQEDEDISQEDLEVLDPLLVKMDTSGDGQISPEEITAALADPKFQMPQVVRLKLIEFMKSVG
ncbi:unnamed protein product [Cladocopium goreaui]|uniref:Uncharacterized protein n=1 Tax=Cladocopium goreaui TaxID=2562237 RepID=A0A9P1BI38_9DINO|nr:unnamed protein product [Cladocopium goreaui]